MRNSYCISLFDRKEEKGREKRRTKKRKKKGKEGRRGEINLQLIHK